jgi:1,4-alpha-glucan branching enzyme
MKLKFLLLLIIFSLTAFPQLITWTPDFPTDSDSIVVLFDATKGNQGLMNYTGDVYAHTGVLTNLSPTPSAWRYVKTQWGQNTPETKLERVAPNLYRFRIKPSVREFYGVPQSEVIKNVAFVFRSGVQVGGSYLEGKTETGGDIFLPIYSAGLNVVITSPAAAPFFPNINDTVAISVVSSHSISLALYLNNNLLTQTSDSSLTYNLPVTDFGKHKIKAVAEGSTGSIKEDSVYFVVNFPITTAPLPEGIRQGINYTSNTTVTLALFAPEKEFVYVIGDFTNWEVEPELYMKRTPDNSTYWVEVNNLIPQKEYIFQYLVDGNLKIADPYAEKISDPWNDHFIPNSVYPNLISYPAGKTTEIASVLQTAQEPYEWQVTNFQRPEKGDMVIYELLVRDFLSTHSYKTLIDTLPYLKNLGVNVIELMPIMEFEGNESWGYNPMFHLAPDKYYGTKNDLKKFIDECHEMGIAVILDMVLNHAFGQSPLVRLYWDAANNRPASNSPWFNQVPMHPYNVGYDFNHESEATKYFVDRVNRFWLEEYKFDGFRFDLSKGFTQTNSGGNVGLWGQYDQSRINLLKRMADKIWAFDPDAYVILEHFAENSEETVLQSYGMMLWGNMNHQYLEASMGYASNLNGASYKSRGWSQPNLIAYMESHDEERMMYKNLQYGNSSGSYNIKDLNTALERVKLASAFYYTIPGPKFIWQFGELGYDVSINYPCRVCNKPILWEYWNSSARRNVYKTKQALIKLKLENPAFRSNNFSMDVGGYGKRININHPTMNVAVIGNFNVVEQSVNPNFSNAGWWYNYFLGDSIYVSNTTEQISLAPGEFHIYTTVKLPAPEPGIVNDAEFDEYGHNHNFMLLQNYPNPFNPVTKIKYSLPSAPLSGWRGVGGEVVTLKIYDILGNEVTTLVNETKAPGEYEIEWNAANFSSGVYFYTLRAGGLVQTRKLVLLR